MRNAVGNFAHEKLKPKMFYIFIMHAVFVCLLIYMYKQICELCLVVL